MLNVKTTQSPWRGGAECRISSGLVLSGSLFAVMFAYMVRFMAVSIQTVESGLGNIKHSMDETARSLSSAPSEILMRVHLPLMKGTVLTALLIVFVDVMKELPATLILRPFNFNTLAVRAFELASDERLADSSTAARSNRCGSIRSRSDWRWPTRRI